MKKLYHEARAFTHALGENAVGAHAAAAAFFIITSFFPFMLLLVSLIRLSPIEAAVQEALSGALSQSLADTVAGDFLAGFIDELTARAAGGALLTAAGLSALWAASRFLVSVIEGLNMIYDCEHENPRKGWLKVRLVSFAYLVALQVILIVALGAFVLGESINDYFITAAGWQGVGGGVLALRWLVGLVMLSLVFLLGYTYVPQRTTRLRSQLPGAVMSAAGWLVFSWLFSYYIGNVADFGAVYGSLGAAITLMLWLYFCMFIMFTGAQFNEHLRNQSFEQDFHTNQDQHNAAENLGFSLEL
ncbi:MAG: YihY/virulence factor BrkB family protein [Oscillospiraceae bacterium]|nr:YihY/virulence factor BrkB family protein [Oscillospiraceae bacterium]